MADIQVLELVGTGGHSKVYKGRDNSTGTLVAVKVLNNLVDGLSKSLWLKETEALTRLSSRNIVKLLSSNIQNKGPTEEYQLVLEWLQESLMERYGRGAYRFQPNTWSKYAGGLVNGMAHAHERNLAHRDIKPDNLLFRSDMDTDTSIVIVDFGISKITTTGESNLTTANYGSDIYTPQDGASRDAFSRDVYSVAAVLTQLTSEILFTDVGDMHQALELSQLPPEINQFLKQCLDPNPEKRPKNMIEFRSRIMELLSTYAPSVTQNSLTIPVFFTTKSADQFVSGANADLERAKMKFNALVSNSSRWSAQIMKPNPDHDDGSTQISMRVGVWVFHCKVDSSRGGNPSLLVLKAAEPTDDELERYSFGSTPLEGKFNPKALLPKDLVPSNRAVEALESLLRKTYQEDMDAPHVPGSFESWSWVLDAREEFVKGNLKPIKFSRSKLNNGLVIFTVDGNVESELMDTAWDIKGLRHVFFEVEGFDGVELWARPSRELTSIPENGELVASLGKDAVSLRRQRKAVEDFKNGMAVSSLLAETIENPEASLDSTPSEPISAVLSDLDEDKTKAVGLALNSQDVFVVQGPPGTGKTSFIAEYAHQIRLENPEAKILLVAQTHVAVDNALLRLESNGILDIVRIGDSKDPRISKGVKKFLVEVKIGDWVENIRVSSEANLARRAGIEPDQLDKLRALSLLFELLAARKQLAYLRNRQNQGTTALEESFSPEEPSKVAIAISRTETLLDNLRAKLALVAPGIAEAERTRGDQDCQVLASTLSGNFKDSEKLVALLKLQTDWLLKIHTDADLRSKYLRRATVVAGTCIGFLRESAVRDFQFDYCIVDEASKATATETLVPMAMARHVVLVGDDKQLPPNDEELLESTEILLNHGLTQADVATTLFSSLKDRLPETKTSTLKTQWRMTRAIGNLISHSFYDSELISPSTKGISGYESLFGKQVMWLDTSKNAKRFETQVFGGGYSNWVEATEIASQLLRLAKRIKSRHLHIDGNQPGILIVSPYRAQRKTILEQIRRQDQELLNGIEWRIETADAVQGSEADIVIVATTRSNGTKKLGFLGMAHWRRINVALSRARYGLIIVGDTKFMQETTGPLSKVLEYIQKNPEDCAVMEVEH